MEVPASLERGPTPLEQVIPEVVHPVQYGIVPERIALPRPHDEILSGYDEDVSSIRDVKTVWRISDPGLLLMRHVVIAGSAKPDYRGAHDRRQFFSQA